MQAELRRRRTDEGDLELNFDPSSFDPTLERRLDQNTGRIGLRFSPSVHSDFLGSLSYGNRDDEQQFNYVGRLPATRSRFEQNALQSEFEYIFRHASFNASAGFGFYDVDTDFKFIFSPPNDDFSVRRKYGSTQETAFFYWNAHILDDVSVTTGANYDRLEQGNLSIGKFNPKLGIRWELFPGLVVRGAVFRTLTPDLNANQTVQLTQIAGFDQFFDDGAGTEAWSYAIGLDTRIDENVMAGVEIARRELDEPLFLSVEDKFIREDRKENSLRIYFYWAIGPEWGATGEFKYEDYDGGTGLLIDLPSKVETLSVPVGISYFSPLGIFSGLGATFVNQHVTRNAVDPQTGDRSQLPEGDDSFATIHAWLGYRFPQRRGLVSLDVQNIFDKKFKYQDESFRQFSNSAPLSRYFPERTVIGRMVINF